MYIVKGEPREGYGAVIVTKTTRRDALATAVDFLDQGIPAVTITDSKGRTYTAEQFAMTLGEK
jgi:hypothetical protein